MTRDEANAALVKKVQVWLGVEADGHAGVRTNRAWDEKTRSGAGGGEVASHELTDAKAFFDSVRNAFGALTQSQVDGFGYLLGQMKHWPLSWAAYGLATAWHETAETMQPIKERGGDVYFHRMYDKDGERPHVAKRLGNTQAGDGVRFAGRGYVQITGRDNYARYSLVNNPDDALKPDVAARVMVDGMENGRFTGKKLADYLPGDYVTARRIVNGLDRAADVAGYARSFERALRAGGW